MPHACEVRSWPWPSSLGLRVGDLRLVYLIDDAQALVVVLRVARRSESTYRNLPRKG
jgi:mRNA-degrading endonuclease RelE of RelBE toxin-antitoxin system